MKLNKVIMGDAIEVLKTLPDKSVDCLVTSPPYWALRDYGVAGQLGLEPTFQEYITKLCDIFDEVKRVLKDEGTCWVNIGDTYSSSGGKQGAQTQIPHNAEKEGYHRNENCKQATILTKPKANLPDKSLCCIPDRFKIEMINRGWICRNEIIWFKPNCMPASVKDRFTVDYEKVFFFVKQKKYFFKTQYEPMAESTKQRDKYGFNGAFKGQFQGTPNEERWQEGRPIENPKFYNEQGRNKRCVWQVTTKPFKEAHFATYPEKLIEPMIDAGCPVGGIVLDPFFGAGTTAVVAKKQGKNYIGIELNPEYIEIAEARLNAVEKD